MSAFLPVSSGTITDATGACQSSHLFYATNTGLWWLFFFSSTSTTSLYVECAATLTGPWSTPTNAPFTLAHDNSGSGSAFGLDYASIGGRDVVHLNITSVIAGTATITHLRATLAGTTITWGTEVQTFSTTWGTTLLRGATSIGTDGSIVDQGASGFLGNVAATKSSNLDTGSAWTTGFAAGTNLFSTPTITISYAILPLTGAAGHLLLGDNGAVAGAPTNIMWSIWKPSAWAPNPATTVFATNVSIGANDWGACLRTDTDAHCVRYEGGGVFRHRRWNGTSWADSAGNPQSLAISAGGGVALTTDGVSVWLCVISSDATSSVQTNTWTVAGGWGGWTIIEGSAQGRRALTATYGGPGKQLVVCWSQQVGAAFDIAITSIATGITTGTALSAAIAASAVTAAAPTPAVHVGQASTAGAGLASGMQVARVPFSPTVLDVVNNVPAASGLSCQTQTIYATNGARWWRFWSDSTAPTSVLCAWSTDLLIWTPAASGTLALAHANEGRNLCVAYANAGGTDVVHVSTDHLIGTTGEDYFLRARMNGPAITWGADTALATNAVNTPAYYTYTGVATALSSTGLVYVASGYLANNCDVGNIIVSSNTVADTGASWTPGSWLDSTGAVLTTAGTPNSIEVLQGYGTSVALIPLATGQMLLLGQDDPSATGLAGGNLYAAYGAAGVWGAPVALFGTELAGAYLGAADWGWAARTTSDVHVVVRLPATTSFAHFRFNGTDWTTVPGDALPPHSSIGGAATDTGGIALTTDGTAVWAFLIDSAAGNGIYACQWVSGGGWGTWTPVTRTAAVRSFLSAAHTMVNGTTALSWTEGAASPYSLMTLAYPIAGLTPAALVVAGAGLASATGILALPSTVATAGAATTVLGGGTAPAIQSASALSAGADASAVSSTNAPAIQTSAALTGGAGTSVLSGSVTPAVRTGSALSAGAGSAAVSGGVSAVVRTGSAATAGAGQVTATGTIVVPVLAGTAVVSGAGQVGVSPLLPPGLVTGAVTVAGAAGATLGQVVAPALVQGSAGVTSTGAGATAGAISRAVQTGSATIAGAGQVAAGPSVTPAVQVRSAATLGAAAVDGEGAASPATQRGSVLASGAGGSTLSGAPLAAVTAGSTLGAGASASTLGGTVAPATQVGGAASGAGTSAAVSAAFTPAIQSRTATAGGAGAAAVSGTFAPTVQTGFALGAGAGAATLTPLTLSFATVAVAGMGGVALQALSALPGTVGGFALVIGAGGADAAGSAVPVMLTGMGAASGGGTLIAAGSALPASIATSVGAAGAGMAGVVEAGATRLGSASMGGAGATDVEGAVAPAIQSGAALASGAGAGALFSVFIAGITTASVAALGAGAGLLAGQTMSAIGSAASGAGGGGLVLVSGSATPAVVPATATSGGAGAALASDGVAPAVQSGATLAAGAGALDVAFATGAGTTLGGVASAGAGSLVLSAVVAPAVTGGAAGALGAGSALGTPSMLPALLLATAAVLGAGSSIVSGSLASAVQAEVAQAAGGGGAAVGGLVASAITPGQTGAGGGGALDVLSTLLIPVQVASVAALGAGMVLAAGVAMPVLTIGSVLAAGAGQATDPHLIVLITLPPILGVADYQYAMLTTGDYQALAEVLVL